MTEGKIISQQSLSADAYSSKRLEAATVACVCPHITTSTSKAHQLTHSVNLYKTPGVKMRS